jgi:hypothetical protein
MRRALVHILGALAVGWIAPYLFDTFISYGTTIVLVAVFTIVFPALLYAFLASAWFIRIAHAALTR